MYVSRETIERVSKWLNTGDSGKSSLYMACNLLSEFHVEPAFWPHDPSDFQRCYLFMELLEDDEQRALLSKLAEYSDEWQKIDSEWHNLRAYYLQEKDQRTAPKLYEYMKGLLL